MKKTFQFWALILFAAVSLTSCGGGSAGGSAGTTTSYYANWTCGTSTQCTSVMGAASGSQGPFSALSDCQSWCNTYIPGACSCSSSGSGGGTTYTVTYNANGAISGSVPIDANNYQQGQIVTVLGNTGNLLKTNYFFSGWNSQADGSGTTHTQGQTFGMSNFNVTLYAKWTANPTYTVTYDGSGNTSGSVPVDSTHYLQGQTVTVLGNTGNLVKTGYSFAGWHISYTTYTQSQTFTINAGNVTLYALWTVNPTFTVTYSGNGNTGGSVPIDSTHYEQGQTVTVLGNTGNLVKSGYAFTGWNTQANGAGTTYLQAQTFTMGAANVTFYAIWTANPYTVTYNGNGNTGGSVPVDSTNYVLGQTVTVLGNTGNIVKTGYSFTGWNTQSNGSGTLYTQGQTFAMGAANVALYAVWTTNATYIVTYDGNSYAGGSVPVDTTNYQQGQTVTVLGNTGNLVKTGYSFTGWNTQANGSGTSYTQGQTFAMGAANVTLYAIWTANVSGFGVAYMANNGSNNISQYTIGATGALTPMSPATVAAGTNPSSVAVDPSGKYAYVTNSGNNNVSQYTIGATGALAPMSPATVAAGTSPSSVKVAPSGKYAYVTSDDNNVSQYTISANGALAPMTPATVAAGTLPRFVAVDPLGKCAYVANVSSGSVSQFTIGANGALAPMSPATVAAGTSPYSVTVDPSGKYAYVANQDSNNVSQYTIGADGSLTPMTTATVAAGYGPYNVTVDPSGKYAYVENAKFDNVSQYTIGADGSLTPMMTATVAAGSYPRSVTVEPSGQYAYVANTNSNNVSQYTIGADGSLTPMTTATIAAGTSPVSITTVGY